MPKTTAPGSVTTFSGSPLPIVALPQQELFTVNSSELPVIKAALGPGIDYVPLRLDLERNEWVVLATFAPGCGVPLHYHSGPAEVFTLQGRWMYREYPDQPQTAGSYLYEPAGSVHTLFAPADNTEDTVILVRVQGTNVNFNEDGSFHSLLDALTLRHLTDTLSVEQDLPAPRYIDGGEISFTEAPGFSEVQHAH